MTDICRLCASLKRLGALIPLSDPSQAVKKKLRRCCQLELPLNDEFMPQSVCHDCVGQLNVCWSFAERVEQVQETLRQAFIDDFVQERSSNSQPADSQSEQDNVKNKIYEPIPPVEVDSISIYFLKIFNSCDLFKAQVMRPKEPSFKLRSMCTSLHLKGFTNQQISEKLNISESKVNGWIFTYQSATTTPSVTIKESNDHLMPLRNDLIVDDHLVNSYVPTPLTTNNTIDQSTQIVVINDLQSSFVSVKPPEKYS